MKLDFCICEALNYIHLTTETALWVWLSITTNIIIYVTISSKVEWRMIVDHYQTAIQIQLKVLYTEISGRTNSILKYSCMMPQMMNIR